jgi:hypothetical protein
MVGVRRRVMIGFSVRAYTGGVREQVLSGIDLLIDFATLGEYGLEPVIADASPRTVADPVGPPEPVDFREAIRRFAA